MNLAPESHNNHGSEPAAEFVFASSPEGLVSVGDTDAMQRFILLSAAKDGDSQQPYRHGDAARSALFDAANNKLVKVKDGRVMRLRLFAWPVTTAVDRAMSNPYNLQLSGRGDTRVALKFRELWARVVQANPGVVIAPMAYATHLNAVLGISPVQIRECVRGGAALYSGNPGKVWKFSDEDSLEHSEPDLPPTYLFCAFMAWELGTPEPTLRMDSGIQREFQSLIEGILTYGEGVKVRAYASAPSLFQSAITDGQKSFYRALYSRCRATGRALSLSYAQESFVHNLTATIIDRHEDETDITTRYSNLWRPMAHLHEIERSIHDLMMEADSENSRVTNAFDEFQPSATAGGFVH